MAIGGKDTTWKHGTNGAVSTNTDFTAKTLAVSPSFDSETVDATTFGDAYRDHEMSFKNATIGSEYKYDATVWGQIAAIYNNGDTVTFEWSPDGTASTKPKVTGSMFIKTFNPSISVGELSKFSVDWQVTGAVTFGSHS